MGYIKEPHLFPNGSMFGKNTRAGVLDRHQPATKIRHFCLQRQVFIV
jgi:hypothetical protein